MMDWSICILWTLIVGISCFYFGAAVMRDYLSERVRREVRQELKDRKNGQAA